MHHTLEGSRLFPYIAWTIVVSFALFTYTLVIELDRSLEALDRVTDSPYQLQKRL